MILLDNLKAVDVNLALNLMGGYEQVYRKVVDSFLTTQENLIQNVEYNLGRDYDEARRLVHSCKGISKNIGSEKLYEVCAYLEKAIIDRNEALIEFYFTDFKIIFTQVINDLTKIKFDTL